MSEMVSPAPAVKGAQALAIERHTFFATALGRFCVLTAVHVLIFVAAYVAAYLLRFELSIPDDMRSVLASTLPWVLMCKIVVFYYLGSFHVSWRFVTFSDLTTLLRAATVSTLLIFVTNQFVIPGSPIPLVSLVLDWGVTIMALGGVRSATRILREHLWPAVSSRKKRPVLVIGAEKGGEALARQIHARPELNYRVVGFLDNNPAYYGSRLGGIPFLGCPEDAIPIARQKKVGEIFALTGSHSGQYLRSLVTACRRNDIRVKMIPPLEKLLDQTYRLQVRDVDINDLLRRDPVQLDTEAIAEMLEGRRVMVTGAGGSIGSEICRQVAEHRPAQIILVERAEHSLFHIDQELARDFRAVVRHPCVADVGDEKRLHVVFQRHEPQVVFHAAAHKHVPLMECNAGEAVKNNVFGTKNVADLAHKYDADRFILISTDKVVNPTSVMGISKKLCERYVRTLADTSATRFVVVRFGNVLGSNGSVVPMFQEQIRRGGPVTVTHADMRRFFMTIPEASQLVLQAAELGNGGEIFVLEMGQPVRIVDLAEDLIRLSGFSQNEIQMTFVGIRPGEKLYEEIYDSDERTFPTSNPKIRLVQPGALNHQDVWSSLAALEPLVNSSDETVRAKLRQLFDSLDAGQVLPPSVAK